MKISGADSFLQYKCVVLLSEIIEQYQSGCNILCVLKREYGCCNKFILGLCKVLC